MQFTDGFLIHNVKHFVVMWYGVDYVVMWLWPVPISFVHTCAQTHTQKQQALLGQMLIEGYGCEADPLQGREWVEKARRRGYRTSGVYCEL